MRISDWSSDVCSSDLPLCTRRTQYRFARVANVAATFALTRPRVSSGSAFALRITVPQSAAVSDSAASRRMASVVSDSSQRPKYHSAFLVRLLIGVLGRSLGSSRHRTRSRWARSSSSREISALDLRLARGQSGTLLQQLGDNFQRS